VRIDELEKKQGEPTLLSNFGDVEYDGYNNVLRDAINSFAGIETIVEFQGSLLNIGIPANIINTTIFEVTGYDGVIAKWLYDSEDGKTKPVNIYVPFFPEQIKTLKIEEKQ